MKLLGSAGEIFLFGNLDDILKLAQFHRLVLPFELMRLLSPNDLVFVFS
jgi:hypothetical protein